MITRMGGNKIMQQVKIDTQKSLINEMQKIEKRYLIAKRIFDIIISICGMILLSPIFIIIGLLIKFDSKGSVFFAHNRIGQDGKLIKVYKFRTMKVDAEKLIEQLNPSQKEEFEKNFKIENDPRVTKLGQFLRKASLDELPQLLNILIGNMSTVGPRPVVRDELVKYGENVDKFLSIKPGLTGKWQVNGRSDTTYEERVKLDMEYIDDLSFWNDIKIVIKTFICVIKKKGAM